MDDEFQVLREDIDTSRPQFIVFTSIIDNELEDYLCDDFNFETSLRHLNLKEQLRIRSIKNPEVRNKQLINRLFKRFTLNYIIDTIKQNQDEFNPWNELDFKFNRFGKPYLQEQELYSFQFSDSSSNKVLAIVFELNSLQSIGVDLSHSKQDSVSGTKFIEQFKPIFDVSEIKILNDVVSIENRYIAFNQLWTLKEAFTKLLGCGLNIDLSRFFFDINKKFVYNQNSTGFQKRSIISRSHIYWTPLIDVNVDKLIKDENEFLKDLDSGEFYCRSGVLFEPINGDLPVIISIINQIPLENTHIKSYNLNICDILGKHYGNE